MSKHSGSQSTLLTQQSVDKSQIPSIDQKRMVAFINHFIVNTVEFLNKFVANCETKFIEFETKLQKVEASLTIVEAKLSSIPDSLIGGPVAIATDTKVEEIRPAETTIPPTESKDEPDDMKEVVTEATEPTIEKAASIEIQGVKVSDDVRYRKYFKMLQFGVPPAGVKQKMEAEGFNSNLLDEPNRILDDGIAFNTDE